MKQKQFFFALVAMLSFVFSGFAQTKVYNEADLKAALESTQGGSVVLGNDIELSAQVTIPKNSDHTLDLNGKKITGNHSGYVFDITGSLTVNDSLGTGTVTGKSRVFTVKSKGSLTLNGGKFYKTSGQVIYTSGKLLVNGASVETKPGAALNVNTAAITGAGGTVELKAGTVTSVVAQFCDLKISGATVTDGLNIYKGAKGAEITAGTIKGDVTIADEAKSKVTISGGSFPNADVSEYLADGMVRLENGEVVAGMFKVEETGVYYPTLAAALEAATEGATVTLLSSTEESIATINNVTLQTTVAGGVTVKNTYSDWIDMVNVTIGSGVTLDMKSVFYKGGENVIEGALNAATLYNGYDAKTTVQNGGKIATTGMIVNRYHTAADAGIYVYGDGNASTVEVSCANTIGTYSGTFYAKDAVVNGNMLWIDYLKDSTQEADKYSQSKPVFENSTVNITKELRLYKDATLTLVGANVTAGTVQVRENATPTVNVDANSTIKATTVQNLAGASMNAVLENGVVSFKVFVAKVGDKKFYTLDEAVQTAKVGDKIALLDNADLAFAHNPQYNNVYASEIDLNGKTMTIKKGDVRFDNVTIKNGNIIVQPGTYNGTAIFLMYSKNLTFDGVKVTATGVAAAAYLIGLEGTSNLNLLNGSEIVINNESLVNISSIIADNGNGNTVTIKDSKIDIKNSNARLYLGGTNGNITVENSDIDLNGVKEGFYLRAGQTLAITGTSTVDITLNTNEGRYGINLTDATAKYTKAETATVNATTFEKKGGNNFNGYTSADGIWGETWGNAKESFVIKVLDANGNVMGTTSLNNEGGIIDGDVNVSWNLKFNAAANTDEYWTMAWTTAPSISNMPARVALWVDGVEVSGGPVVLNGPDDLNKIVAAVTDADGKIISCHTSVANAAATNATNIALLRNTTEEIILPAGVKLKANGFNAPNVKKTAAAVNGVGYASLADAMAVVKAGETVTVYAGTYAMPSMKAGITIVGEGEVMFEGTLTGTLENLTMKNIHIKGANAQRWAYAKGNLVFENVTFEATSIYALHFDGITEGATLTYKNCTIIGWAAMSGSPASCVFDGCTFKGNGTYGVIRTYFDAEIKNCTFDVANVNTNDAYQDGIHAVDGAKVVVDNCTNANVNGTMKDLVNVSGTSEITVDGKVYKNVAKVDDNYYATLAEAFTAVGDGAGKTVELIADVDLAGAEWTPVNFNGVFDGKDHTISNLVVNGAGKSNQGFFAQTNNGEIKNVTFNNAKVTGRLNVGVVAGTPYTSKYTNVKVTGHVEVNGMAYVGGVGGKNAYANWTDITVNVDETSYVKATSTENGTAYRTYVGGVIGFNGEGGHTFKNISSNIKVIGDVMDIGGIFGILHYSNKAENITFTGAVEAPAEAKEVGGIAGVWHNEKGYVVTITNAKSEGPVKIGDVITTGSIVGGAYNAANQSPATSGSLMIDGKEAWAGLAKIDNTYYATLQAAISEVKAGETITLLADIESSDIITINKSITLDGNSKTLTSTATRAINVSGANGVTIKNLSINASGERAINVIQNATNVTIENVTATAANYTVNVAASAPNAVVAIKNSNLTGLNVVNVAAEKAYVTVENTTINTVDNNANEGYSSLALNKDAVDGKIIATDVTINITGSACDDSVQATNAADGGVISINGSTDGVDIDVAAVEYGDYYYGFTTIEAAIKHAEAGQTVKLVRDVTVAQPVAINKAITLDGNGKTLTSTATGTTARAINVDCEGDVAIKNLTINASGERAINVIQKPANVTIDGVTATAANYTVNLAGSAAGAVVVVKNSNLTGLNVVNVAAAGAQVTVDNTILNCADQSEAENYAALTLNKDAKNGSIVATNVTFNIEGNSRKASNQAEGGTITIDGSANEVEQHVAYISYGSNWYGFATIEAAIAKANAGETVTLLRDIKASAIITIDKAITLDGNGKTLTSTAGRAINVETEGNVAIKNLTINAKGERAINIINLPANVTVDNVTATAKNNAVMMATSATGAKLTVNNSDFTGLAVVNVASANSKVEINNTKITNVDANEGENYGAISIFKSALNAEVVVNGGEVVVAADSKAASIGAAGATVTFNGTKGNTEVQTVVAYIGDAGYTSIEEAIKDAKAGDVVTIMPGEYNMALNVNKADITVQGEVDAEGNNLVKFNGKLNITANGAAVKNIDVKNSGTAAYINAADVLVEKCNLEGSNGLYQSYAKGTVKFKNSVITGGTYGVHFDGSTGGNIVIEGCTITGWTSFAGTIANVEISKTTFADGNYDRLRFYQNATLTECVFNENMTVDFGKNTIEAEFTECTVENGKPLTDVIYLGDIAEGVKVTIDDKPISVQAKAGKNYYQTLLEAVEAAKTGETVTVLTDVNVDTKNCVTCGGYSSIFNVMGIELTFDLNGHTITVDADPADFVNAKSKMLMGVFTVDDGGKLTIDDSSDDKTGAVNVKANKATVYSLASAYGKDAKLTINNGSYYVDEMPEATSLIYAQHSESVIINGGTYNIGNVGKGANGSPWIFNTKGQNMDGIYVYGGTYPTDINHQFWFNEAVVPGNLAVKENENGTWSVVEAAAYTNERGTSTGSWRRNVGYATIEEAIAATQMYNYEGNVVTLAKSVEIEQMITVANGVEVTLDLNGKTLAATDNTSKNYSAIDNRGDLTIVDSSEEATGKITVKATVNSGWNRYSAVIANNPGGTLTVEAGTIEHLGGTDMAYGIDNLTNGKGTYAETIINGGEIKSTYRPIRMFLNGVEAQNILTVNAGTIESTGGNKAIWMQDPSANANTGTLHVDANAEIKNNIFLSVTKGSTEWPVKVYVEKDALAEGMIVETNANVPADAAALVEYDTFWQVEQKNLAKLTIEDACEEYINKIEKNVGELTYEREFVDTLWQTIVLPFDVPVANLMDKFEIAYIYNATYKNKAATIDYVEIKDAEFVLAANYPYLIKAKEAGDKSIVVENAKLMPTEVKTIDCSSVFETFSFIGNYATVDTEKGYFNLISGAWSKLGTVNPFRFYMQIEKRDGSAFEYPGTEAKAIRMRQVDANGEATGIDSVGAATEQNSGLIFDLHGRRVVEPKKGGLYIVNGKKVVF